MVVKNVEKSKDLIHTIQRPMLSKGAKCTIFYNIPIIM